METRFVAYYRVSKQSQGIDGLGMDAQKRAVQHHVSTGSRVIIKEFCEVESGRRSDRPQLTAALDLCKLTGATLLIAKLDRLARNVHFLTGLQEQGVDFIACDMPHANKLTVHILAAVAQDEAERISARTRDALQSIKERIASGEEYVSRRSGRHVTRLGNPNGISQSRRDLGTAATIAKADAFAQRILPTARALRDAQHSLKDIASRLNAMHVPTARGSTWTPTAVSRVLVRS